MFEGFEGFQSTSRLFEGALDKLQKVLGPRMLCRSLYNVFECLRRQIGEVLFVEQLMLSHVAYGFRSDFEGTISKFIFNGVHTFSSVSEPASARRCLLIHVCLRMLFIDSDAVSKDRYRNIFLGIFE